MGTATGESEDDTRPSERDSVVATFPPVAESVRAARSFVQGLVPEELRDRAVLLVSELATNAVLYTRRPFEVRVRLAPTRRIEVRDASFVLPTMANPSNEDAHGRGLHIVQTFASAWGISPDENGKVIWFEL